MRLRGYSGITDINESVRFATWILVGGTCSCIRQRRTGPRTGGISDLRLALKIFARFEPQGRIMAENTTFDVISIGERVKR